MRLQSHSPHALSTTSFPPPTPSLCSVLLTAAFSQSPFSPVWTALSLVMQGSPLTTGLVTSRSQSWFLRALCFCGSFCSQTLAAAGTTNCSSAAMTFSTGQRPGSGSVLMSLSSVITVRGPGKQHPVAPTTLGSRVWTCLTLLPKARTGEQWHLVLFTCFLPLDSGRNVRHQDQKGIRK